MNDQTQQLELPTEGGSYNRLPDGTLERNPDGSLKRNKQPHEEDAEVTTDGKINARQRIRAVKLDE